MEYLTAVKTTMSDSLLFSKGNHVVLGTQAVIIITITIIINIMCYAYLVTDTMIKVTR